MQPKAFDPRQSMPDREFELQYKRDLQLSNVELHHHDFYEIFYLISGNVTYTVDSHIYRVLPGDVLFIPPGVLHQVNIRKELAAYERYVLWVGRGLIRELTTDTTDPVWMLSPENTSAIRQLRLQPKEQAVFRQLLEALLQESDSAAYGADLQCRSLICQLLIRSNRLAMNADTGDEALPDGSLIHRVLEHIKGHYSEDLSLDALAARFFVSKYHLSREFNRQVGTGLHRYIRKKRLQVARELLLQGEKPTAVCSLCGFADYAVFFRAFKDEYGCSPRQFPGKPHS